MRKGMMKGSGKRGYHNIIGKDPMVHSQSAKGIKQAQRIPNIRLGSEGISETDPLGAERSELRKIAYSNDISPELFEDFMIRAFDKGTRMDKSYLNEWARRFRTGQPIVYMDSKRRAVYFDVLKKYYDN